MSVQNNCACHTQKHSTKSIYFNDWCLVTRFFCYAMSDTTFYTMNKLHIKSMHVFYIESSQKNVLNVTNTSLPFPFFVCSATTSLIVSLAEHLYPR